MNHALMTAPDRALANHETAATAAAAQVKALVEARYTIAMHRPRDMDAVRQALMKECARPSFAAVARYHKPIGKGVVGPSIRFAEAAARCMTNMVIEETTVYDDDEKRIVQISVCDLEANVAATGSITIEKTVERSKASEGDEVIRKRKNSRGQDVFIIRATEDDLLNKRNAMGSKAIRTLILRLVPGDIVDECMAAVVKTQNDADAKDPDGARCKLVDAFASINVTVADLKAYVGTDLAKLSPAELAELRALHAAIKDGESTWRAAMEAKNPEAQKASRTTEAFGGTAAPASAPSPAPTPAPSAPGKKPEAKAPAGPVSAVARAPALNKDEVLALAKTKDGAEVDGVLAKYELHSIGEIQTDIVLAAVSFEIAKLPNMKA
jgi:hypothetical protein